MTKTFIHGHPACGLVPTRSIFSRYDGTCWCCAKPVPKGDPIHLVQRGEQRAWLCDSCIGDGTPPPPSPTSPFEDRIKRLRSYLQDVNPLTEPEKHDEAFKALVRLEAQKRAWAKEQNESISERERGPMIPEE